MGLNGGLQDAANASGKLIEVLLNGGSARLLVDWVEVAA